MPATTTAAPSGTLLQTVALVHAATALVLARLWSTCEGRTVLILLGAALVASLGGAWLLWLRDSFESRAIVGLTAAATALGALLALTVGMPGGDGGVVTWTYVLLLALPATVLVLLALVVWRRTSSADA